MDLEYDITSEWTIERIIKKRYRKEKFVNSVVSEAEYLVKWEGFDEEYNSWCTVPEMYDLGVSYVEEAVEKFAVEYNTGVKKKKRVKEKEKKIARPDPERWTYAVQLHEDIAAIEEAKLLEILKKEREEMLAQTMVDEAERFRQELEDARAIQEMLSERIQAQLQADIDNASDSDEDWEWEEIVSPLEEFMPPQKRETDESREKKRQNELRVVRRNVKKKHYVCNEDPSRLREAIVCVLGHVDAGKTTLLDTLRHSNVQKGEAGGITQQIGATHIPIEYIKTQIEELNKKFNADLKLPGFLFIDTPGHESFSNMRVRGSSLCDIAVVVVDILHGLQSQAKESLRLLKRGGSCFVIALNKIDKLHGWKAFPKRSFRHALEEQTQETKDHFKKQLQFVRDELMEQGIISTAYWNCKDLNVQVPVIPICGLDGCGIPDLLMYTMLYAQCVLTKQLTKNDQLECAVFEVHEAQGLGQTIDVLLINGELRVGDRIILCGLQGPIITSIRGIFSAKDMQELKGQQREADTQVEVALPVRGVTIWARDLDFVVGGSYLYVLDPKDDIKKMSRHVMSQLEDLKTRINISKNGLHVQASTLGSLEALLEFLNENGVAIGSYGLGEVHVKDVKRVLTRGGLASTLIAFDVAIAKPARHFANVHGVDIISGSVIYQLLDMFKIKLRAYLNSCRNLVNQHPCILSIAPAYIIHPFTPLIIGVHVVMGRFNIGTRLHLIDNTFVGEIESIQNITTRAAVYEGREGQIYIIKLSAPGGQSRNVVYGRDFFEEDKFFTRIDRRTFDTLVHGSVYQDTYYKKLLDKYRGFLGFTDENGNAKT